MGAIANKLDHLDKSSEPAASAIEQAITVCRCSAKLFARMSRLVEDRRFQSKFENHAAVRNEIVDELETVVVGNVSAASNLQSNISYQGTIAWYEEALDATGDTWRSCSFIEDLRLREAQILKVLKTMLQMVESQAMKRRLSSLFATFQVHHDKLKDLKAICH